MRKPEPEDFGAKAGERVLWQAVVSQDSEGKEMEALGDEKLMESRYSDYVLRTRLKPWTRHILFAMCVLLWVAHAIYGVFFLSELFPGNTSHPLFEDDARWRESLYFFYAIALVVIPVVFGYISARLISIPVLILVEYIGKEKLAGRYRQIVRPAMESYVQASREFIQEEKRRRAKFGDWDPRTWRPPE